MRRFPETILFSRMAPVGMSMRSPWLAIIITVPWKQNSCITASNIKSSQQINSPLYQKNLPKHSNNYHETIQQPSGSYKLLFHELQHIETYCDMLRHFVTDDGVLQLSRVILRHTWVTDSLTDWLTFQKSTYLKRYTFTKGDISWHGKMIQIQHVWDAGKTSEELLHLRWTR